MPCDAPQPAPVAWLRQVSPYFRRHRGRTFVVYVDGGAMLGEGFTNLVRDLVLLAAVGIRLVLVFGARPQIEARLRDAGVEQRVVRGLRASDAATMNHVREVVGGLRLQIESAFSFGSRGGPVSGAAGRVASGNFVRARPAGIVDGIDLMFTGEVRSIDRAAINACLDREEIVLIPPIGYASSGELFNLRAKDLAAAVASSVDAAKLIFMTDREGIEEPDGTFRGHLTVREAETLAGRFAADSVERDLLQSSVAACRAGVERVHLIDRERDGAILTELFTRDGIGTLVTNAPFDQIRAAQVADVAGIVDLIRPLETEGLLVPRTESQIEQDVGRFLVVERENTVVACGALYPVADSDCAEIACIAVHGDYRGSEFGELLVSELETRARRQGITQTFVLTTRASHWFAERGYEAGAVADLPPARREGYNAARNSAVLFKQLA